MHPYRENRGVVSRRSVLAGAFAALGWSAFDQARGEGPGSWRNRRSVAARERIKITKLETLLVKPRWLFLKVHTDAGIVGLGEPIVEGRPETVATAIKEIEPYLMGKDPRRVVAPLAGDLPARVLSRRADPHQCPERDRHGALGHQGQGAGRAGLRAAGRADARPGPRLRARQHAGADQARPRPRLHGVQDQPGQASAGAVRRDARRGALRRRASSPSCGRPAATTWTSPSTSTARSARRPPSC